MPLTRFERKTMNTHSRPGRQDDRSNARRNSARRQDRPADNGPQRAAERSDTPRRGDLVPAYGVLEILPKGYGFLRNPEAGYDQDPSDPFVPENMIRQFGLRPGSLVKGTAQHTGEGQGPRLTDVEQIDGMSPEKYRETPEFDALTPLNPDQRLRLETGPEPITTRVMDLLTPLGKGQRALIVAPPRTGKTVLLQQIGQAITTNHPEVKLFVLLIDERPEEVTEMRRRIQGEVLASSLDRDVENHVRLARLVMHRCKRLAEQGHDVLLLLDSLTRLARAFNKWVGDSGRTMTGGLDVKALDEPKKVFASARTFEEGGSLTIVATALIDTGSRMDEAIFQEFKGTGNMELVLDRRLADRRIWPAMDVTQSGTRREEKLLDPATLRAVTALRRTLATMNDVEAMEQLVSRLAKFKSNEEFLALLDSVQQRG
jgi:transcription termination factor Rho